ncbi:hypothetical protein SMACR_04185 [Sordaria macrospora]|uniref:WGS project CABT00000000 data, contig 2.15 n=2 Tax=Sordaria macrospora TaxID=5147 RepID=F7VZK8_SORMK|nr:uncharacterized protein SMAC_04185 [Sordaria macrospora k-hell]KAA8628925.1 hypothetical protein SMACR_04185 [Sordaria macrospora]WPJ64481.1 hypothetical protein SMAC4_04185 [Sordaria macrospora]CCC10956.1 unnamed protein product [Sordaria macrospora k-hell]
MRLNDWIVTNLGNLSSLSAQITNRPSWEQQDQQHQQSQQLPRYQQQHQEFLVPAQNQRNEGPPLAYTRRATTGTRVMSPAPVINSNNAVNQGADMGMDMGIGMGSFSGAQMLGTEWLGNGFGHGLDGDAFSFGNSQVGNGFTFGSVAGSAPRAYQSNNRNGFGFPKNNGINGASIGNHPANGYIGNKNGVNGDVMGFFLPNGIKYSPFIDNTIFYDNNMRVGGGLGGVMDNAFANGFNGISGNTINGHAVEYGLQDSFTNPPASHLTGSNPNRVAQNVPIATVSRPVQPVFQPVFQLSQNVQALNHQDINLNFNFIGQNGNGNGNGNAATNVQPNGVQQPEVAVPIIEEPRAPVPADEPTPARRLPTPVPTPADAEDTYGDAMQQLQELQQQEEDEEDEVQQGEYQQGDLQEDEFQQDELL